MADDLTTNAAGGDLGLAGAPVVPAAPPISMGEAASRKEAFLADKTKTTALLNGDVNATAEWRLITENIYQAPQVAAPRDEVTEALNASGGYQLPADVLQEYRENRPVTSQERRFALAKFEDFKNSPEWFAKYQRGDMQCRRDLTLVQSILSRPAKDPVPGADIPNVGPGHKPQT